jgi:hypothetical protein
MRLTVFNGSGRGKSGNTVILLDAFLKGFSSMESCSYTLHTLIQKGSLAIHTAAFAEAEHVLLAFPMYTDMVPAVVKNFIETLEPYCGRSGNPSIGFIIHCGFPEGVQLRALERYLEKLSRRLGCHYAGTVLKGNSEGLRETSPEKLTALLHIFETLGRGYAQTGEFDRTLIDRLAQPERLPGWMAFIFRILAFTPIVNLGWNQSLKKNGAFRKRFARPDVED